MEQAVYNATVGMLQADDGTVDDDSVCFKTAYWDVLRYVVGAWSILGKKDILRELKGDTWGMKSALFTRAQEVERELEKKLKCPDDVEDDPHYPCPRCHGSKHTKLRRQERGGDEGATLRLWCASRSCGHGWRING